MTPVLALIALSSSQVSPQQPADGENFRGKITKKVSISYLLSLPEDYAATNRRYPIVVFLHGSGERGSDLNVVRVHGPFKELNKGRKFPFIAVAPQCPEGQSWDIDTLSAMLNNLERKYRVDRNREYLTGLSMGGYGTWAWSMAEPKRFAAIAPICGGGDTSKADLIKHIPIWNTHGDADRSVPIQRSIEMINALKAAGAADVRFDIIPGGQHDVWTQVYSGTEIYDWLLSHKRRK
ncbi:MAG: dienelactone hydrolase family protein [Fimbriimonas sp.]